MILAEYYADLLKWEDQPARELISEWPTELIERIKADVSNAVAAAKIIGSDCSLKIGSSNQSVGNQVEAFIVEQVNAAGDFQIENCSGAGYPDRLLRDDELKIPLEMKATSDWNPNDSNRRVLTSSSAKIRAQFEAPIYHLLLTAIYKVEGNNARISGIRLDFLDPETQVNVRLEASVSHKLLSNATHASLVIS